MGVSNLMLLYLALDAQVQPGASGLILPKISCGEYDNRRQ